MEENRKSETKRKLSSEAVNAIKEVTERISSENVKRLLDKFEEELSKKMVNSYFLSLNKIEKDSDENRRNITEKILKKYLPLKNEIEIMEKTIVSKEKLKEGEAEFIGKLMVTQFKEVTTVCETNYDTYLGLKQIFNFLDEAITTHINFLKSEIDRCEQLYEKETNQRVLDSIGRNEKKIFILENYFKKNWSAKKIKMDLYDNERRFLYDKYEVLDEMSSYLSGVIRYYRYVYK